MKHFLPKVFLNLDIFFKIKLRVLKVLRKVSNWPALLLWLCNLNFYQFCDSEVYVQFYK